MIHLNRLFCTAGSLACAFTASALAVDDVPATDPKPILEALKTIKDQQLNVVKTTKQRFIQEATAAASNPARAVELWEEAVRATQFQGAPKENAQFKDWKDKDGEALKDKEVQNALRLYFNWLSLTLQRSAGAEPKTLVPAVLNHAHEVLSDQVAMDAYDEAMKKDAQSGAVKRPVTASAKEKRADNQAVKRMHDQILKQSLSSSAFVQWMRLSDYINDVAPTRQRGGGGGGGKGVKIDTAATSADPKLEEGSTSWEQTPGAYDGIFQSILLPEFRVAKDVRVLEYWDNKLKREAEKATNSQKTFDITNFNQVRRPQILWSRAQDMARIGQRNRAINDMFAQIKAYPTHPDIPMWISTLEQLISPPSLSSPANPPPPAAGTASAPLPAALPGAE